MPLRSQAKSPLARALSRRALAILALCALAAGAIAGCGSSSAPGSDVDPASVVPASAALYAGVTVRPTGSLKSAAQSAGEALTHQPDPYTRLLAALQTPGSPQLDFGKDVAPWLGEHAGVFVTSLQASSALLDELEQGLLGGKVAASSFPFGSGRAQGAIVLDTSDSGKAKSFLDSQAEHASAHDATYRGVSYKVSAGGVAFGLVDRLAVIGSESGLRSVIDTSLGGARLTGSSEYATLLAKAPAEALAHLYTSAGAAAHAGSASGGFAGLLGLLAGGRTANVSLVPTADSLSLDADTLPASAPHASGGLLSFDPQATEGLRQLPGESWLAVGLGHLSTSLPADVQGLQALVSLTGGPPAAGTGGFGLQGLLGALTTPLSKLGADTPQAQHDYASWMGPAGLFASGAGLLELRAAMVIDSTDAASSRAAVGKLGAELHASGIAVQNVKLPDTEAAIAVRLSGLPLVLDIAAGHGSDGKPKFVLALGEASLATALNPPNTLANAGAFGEAQTTLGEGAQPSLIVDFPTLVGLFESVGLLEDPTISKFVPYLRAARTLYGGGHELDAQVERFRLVLGLQPAGG